MKLSVRERILVKITEDAETGCWMWGGFIDHNGYGRMGIGKRTSVLVHRAAWDAWGGISIPPGFELHHVCERKACCNPSHLRMVSRHEHVVELSPNNIAYKAAQVTHCPYGHEYPAEHVRLGNGKRARICRECANRRVREFYVRHPEKRREKIRHDSEVRRQKQAVKTHNPNDSGK